LLSFRLPDGLSGGDDFVHMLRRDEENTIGIREDNIVSCDSEIADAGNFQRILISRVESLRTRRPRSITEHRETNLDKFRGIAVTTPDDDTCQPALLRFEGSKIADTSFVGSAAV